MFFYFQNFRKSLLFIFFQKIFWKVQNNLIYLKLSQIHNGNKLGTKSCPGRVLTFMTAVMRTKINVNRYLFHVSHPCSRNGISKWGLLVNDKIASCIPNGVYAHNLRSKPTYDWYPFIYPFESDIDLGKMYGNNLLRAYDYWRIDTQLIDNNWFIDYAARGDFADFLGYDPKTMYVYTDKDVSLRAITLFRFQNEESWGFKGEKGAFHFRAIDEFRPFKDK